MKLAGPTLASRNRDQPLLGRFPFNAPLQTQSFLFSTPALVALTAFWLFSFGFKVFTKLMFT